MPFEMPDWAVSPPPQDAPPDTSRIDPHQVESLVNGFIAGKQAALFDAPDAYYRTAGADAIAGAPAVVDQLNTLRQATLDSAGDDVTRAALAPRLDAHLDDALDGISRHVETQRAVFHRQTLADRQGLIQRAATLEYDNDAKIAGLAAAQAGAAQQAARLDGIAPDSPESAAIAAAARSQILRTAIDQRIATAKPQQAIDLYDKVKAVLTPADRRALDVPIGAATDDAKTNDWLARESAKDGAPLTDRAGLDDGLSDSQRQILNAKIAAREFAAESSRVATVKGLDDQLAAVTTAIATRPSQYRAGTLNALAQAYDDAGAPEQADDTRRLAATEAILVPFAQSNVAAQQRQLSQMSGPERSMAEAIMNQQADAFAKDPYAAGTALYPSVGPALPEDDVEGRLRQARMIEVMRATPPPTDATTGQPVTAPSDRVLTDGQPSQVSDPNLVLAADEPSGAPPTDDGAPQGDVELAQAKPRQTPQSPAQQNQQKLQRWASIPAAKQTGKGPLPADWQTQLGPTAVAALYKEAATYKVPPEMLAAMIWMESDLKESASAGAKAQGKGLLGVSDDAIDELKRQNKTTNPARFAQLEQWQKGDARMKAEPAISMSAEYLRLLFDTYGHSWLNAATAYKAGEGRFSAFLEGKPSKLDDESVKIVRGKPVAGQGALAKGYLSVVFDGNPERFDSYR